MSRDVGAIRPAPGGADVFSGHLYSVIADVIGDVCCQAAPLLSKCCCGGRSQLTFESSACPSPLTQTGNAPLRSWNGPICLSYLVPKFAHPRTGNPRILSLAGLLNSFLLPAVCRMKTILGGWFMGAACAPICQRHSGFVLQGLPG